jgi:hypothetical protein
MISPSGMPKSQNKMRIMDSLSFRSRRREIRAFAIMSD